MNTVGTKVNDCLNYIDITKTMSKQNTTDLYTVAIMTDKWQLDNTDVDADSPVSVNVLHWANATDCTTHVMFMDWQCNAGVTPTSHQCKSHITFQDVKIPRNYTSLLCHLHQNLQYTPYTRASQTYLSN